MTHMLREIQEQPEVLERLASDGYDGIRSLRQAMESRGIESIYIAARGTSDNAAAFGKYLLEIAGGMPISLAAPSVFTLYRARLDLSKWLVLGISQSGESTDVVEVLNQARDMGALTAAITNVADSTLARTADHALLCQAGEEKSIAATKTYTATLGILYLLTSEISGNLAISEGLASAIEAMRAVLGIEDRIERVVERYRYMEECMVIARGMNQATCQEAALKLSETCSLVAKPYSAADFLHGPIAAVGEGFPVFIYAPPGKTFAPMLDLAGKLAAEGAERIIISCEDDILSTATTQIRIPVRVDEIYSPLVYILVGQLFAQYLAVTKGFDPDQPRGLSKITRTL